MYKPKASGFLRVRSSTWMSTCLWRHFVWQVDPFRTTPCLSSGPFWDSGRDGTGKKKRRWALGCTWQEEKSSFGGHPKINHFQQLFEKHLFFRSFSMVFTTTLARSCIRQTESWSIGNYFTQESVHNGTTSSFPSSLQRDCWGKELEG